MLVGCSDERNDDGPVGGGVDVGGNIKGVERDTDTEFTGGGVWVALDVVDEELDG
jgi:hypothetical protein